MAYAKAGWLAAGGLAGMVLVATTAAALADFTPNPPGTYKCTNANSRMVDITFPYNVFPARGPGRARVLVPSDYSSAATAYPVIYLLHGAGDNGCAWTGKTDGQPSLQTFTTEREAHGEKVVIVMPDGGGGDYGSNSEKDAAGWYSDWCNPDSTGACTGGNPRWEAFQIDQIIPYIESHFRVLKGREHRVVGGLSMGGFGAISLAARHPDMFAGVYSFSGFLNSDGIPYLSPAALAALHATNNTPDSRIWGPFDVQEVQWRGHNPADLVGSLGGQHVWAATGNGVAGGPAPDDSDAGGLVTEAAVGATNNSFYADSQLAGNSVDFHPYAMGGHNWYHWLDDLHTAWPLMMADLAASRAAPATFSYCSIEPNFGLWGWQVHAERAVSEFLSVRRTATGLKLRGSGTVTVTSPPIYQPGATYSVPFTMGTTTPVPLPAPTAVSEGSASLADPCVSSPLATVTGGDPAVQAAANSDGRITFSVTLGPSHTMQQYTPQERAAESSDPSYWTTAVVTLPPAGAPVARRVTGTDLVNTATGRGVSASGGMALVVIGIVLATIAVRRRRAAS